MIYEYGCECGAEWDETRKLRDVSAPAYCKCGKKGTRIISAVPSFTRRTHPDVKQDMHELVAGIPGNYTEI